MPTLTRRQWLAAASAAILEGVQGGPLRAADDSRSKRPRFGPDAVGANTAIPGYGLYEAIALLRRLGFETIEFHAMGRPEPTPGKFPGIQFDQLPEEQRQRLATALSSFPHVTVHLPYSGLRLVSTDCEEQSRSRHIIETALDAAAYFEVEVAVIHCLPPRGRKLEEAWQELVELFRRWGDRAKRGGFRLAIETGYPASVAQFVHLVRDVDHASVGATLDVGHQIHSPEFRRLFPGKIPASPEAFLAYNNVLHQLVDQLGAKLIHFHVHDIDPSVWREHRTIEYGVIDYPRLFRALADRGAGGLFVLEVGGPAEKMEAMLAADRERLLNWIRQVL
ncbi:MAG TPA: sugar phosphate isomerase/epimerase [Planctomycetaceae bacterium]|nr:sugar phosphate isomerase/epimerase [Planctomycetaceae bacterium]